MSAAGSGEPYGLQYLFDVRPRGLKIEPEKWPWLKGVRHSELFDLQKPVGRRPHLFQYRPRGRQGAARPILLVGFRGGEMDSVTKELEALKAPYDVVYWNDAMASCEVSLGIGRSFTGALTDGRRRIDLGGIGAVAYFPTILYHAERRIRSFGDALVFRRWLHALADLEAVMPGVPWFPGPAALCQESAQRRMYELMLARTCGLQVPETLCTTRPEEVRAFLRRHGRIVFREWTTRRVPARGRTIRCFQVRPIERLDDAAAAQIAESPTIFQQYLHKAYEVRAIVVGDEVVSLKIDSQAARSEQDRYDWRGYDFERVGFTRYRLPPEMCRRLVRLRRKLGLQMGSADLVRTVEGGYGFLEMNRPGAWGFFSAIAALGIPRLVARHLQRLSRR